MGIETCYVFRCDHCLRRVHFESEWQHKVGAVKDAKLAGWRSVASKWYCPECVPAAKRQRRTA